MPLLDEKLSPILSEIVRRDAGDEEFHQAAQEVLESLGSVVARHPGTWTRPSSSDCANLRGRSSSAFRGWTMPERSGSTAASASSSTRRWVRTREAFVSIRR